MFKAVNNARILLAFLVALAAFFVSGTDAWLAQNLAATWDLSQPWLSALLDLTALLVTALIVARFAVMSAVQGPMWISALALAAGVAAIWFGSHAGHVTAHLNDPRVATIDLGVMLAWAILAAGALAVPLGRRSAERRHEQQEQAAAAQLQLLEHQHVLGVQQPTWRQIGTRSYVEIPTGAPAAGTTTQQQR